jgi:hypothetical protein
MYAKKTSQIAIKLLTAAALLLLAVELGLPCSSPPPTGGGGRAPNPCGKGAGGPTPGAATAGGSGEGVLADTGTLRKRKDDITARSVGPQYQLTRVYGSRFDGSPGGNYKGDFGWNWTSQDMIRLAAEDAGSPYPASIRVCYETTLERVLYKSSDSPIRYSRASASTADDDIYDVIEQETIDGTAYWRITKPRGNRVYFHPLNAGAKGGRLAMEKDPVGNTLAYTYGTGDRPAYVTDAVGNTIYFTYYPAGDGREGLVKKAEWKFDGTVRQTLYYAYDDQQNLCRVTAEVDDVQNAGQKARRTTLYVYDRNTGDSALDHNLLYVVDPELYKRMQDDNVRTLQAGPHYLKDESISDGSVVYDPDPTTFPQGKGWSDYAASRYTYGTTGIAKDRVTSQVAANGETLTFSYDDNPTDNTELPQDLRDVTKIKMITTTTYAVFGTRSARTAR